MLCEARLRGLMEIGNLIRCAPRAVGLKPSAIQGEARLRGLMEIENLIRCAPRAVGLKPSAIRGEARLRGLESDFWGSPCVPSLVSGIRTPRTPPSPLVGEGG
jgi:hypothetical protein